MDCVSKRSGGPAQCKLSDAVVVRASAISCNDCGTTCSDQRSLSLPKFSATCTAGPCQASRSICAAAGKRLADARARQIRGKDWDVVKSEINTYLNARPAAENCLKDALWFVCAVAASRAAKLRRRVGRNLLANDFFQSVSCALECWR